MSKMQFLVEYLKIKDDSLIYNFSRFTKYWRFKFDIKLKGKFTKSFKFCDGLLNNFCIAPAKGVYIYR